MAQLSIVASSSLSSIRLLGGEPLLHPQILDFVFVTRQAFPNAFIEIVTNGILLLEQDDNFFNTLNKYNISIFLSDYYLNSKIRELVVNKLNQYRIGEKRLFIKPALNLHGSDGIKNLEICYEIFQDPCFNLRNGYIYHCPTEAYFDLFADYFNIKLKDFSITDNGINIFTSTLEEIEDYINKPSNFCKYCSMNDKMIELPWSLTQKKMSEWLA